MSEEQVYKPLEKVLVDIYGPLTRSRYRYIYTFVIDDNFTTQVWLYLLCKANSKNYLYKIVLDLIPMRDFSGDGHFRSRMTNCKSCLAKRV